MTVTQWVMGAATVTATYVRRGKRFRVLVRPAAGRRISRSVKTEADAIALVRHFNRLGLAGVDLAKALRRAKVAEGAEAKSYPAIREALPAFLDEMVAIGEIRKSTAKGYKNRLAVWAYPSIGDIAWNELTRQQIGEVLVKLRAAGRSTACLEQIRCPLTRFYQWQMNAKGYKGTNPAVNLKFFLGRHPSKRARKRDLQWFRQEEARRLLLACRTLKPRWFAFLLVSFGGGLRWGEAAALTRADIDWHRGRVHVQRTWSESGGRVERCKDGEDRWVTVPASTMAALRAHGEAMDLEATLDDWAPEQRQLVFPNSAGRITRYGTFLELVWQPSSGTLPSPIGSRTRCGTATPRGSLRRAPTSAGSGTRWGMPRSGKRKAPTGISCASITSGTWTRSMPYSGPPRRLKTTADRGSL